jgi:hypothetical protein
LCSGEPFGEGNGHGSMLTGYRENRIDQQASYRTAIGAAAG